MAFTYSIDPEQRLVHAVMTGEFTDTELFAYGEMLRADPRFDPDFSQLTDLMNANYQISSDAIREIASRKPLFSSKSRRAVAVAEQYVFAMSRMFELSRNENTGEIRVFYSIAEAQEWLDLNEPSLS